MKHFVSKKDLQEGLSVAFFVALLLFSAISIFMNIFQNYIDVNSMLGTQSNKQIYILNSKTNLEQMKRMDLNIENYKKNVENIKKILKDEGYTPIIISEKQILTLPTNAVLILIGEIGISNTAQQSIINFVKNGGKLIFNFRSGYFDENGNLKETKMIETITGLKKVGYIQREKDHSLFLSQKRLSPIKIKNEEIITVVLYDQIPIFTGRESYIDFTNWGATEAIMYKNKEIPNGAFWSGKFGKGNWVYFSIPMNSFLTINRKYEFFRSLFLSMVNYEYNGFQIVKYPFLKYDKMVLIEEDTEFKFKNLERFADLSKKYDMNVTAFCVGRLAEKYPEMMEKIGKYKNVEIASHSYSHISLITKTNSELKKEIDLNKILLEKLSNQKIVGLRPPREEMNEKMEKRLLDSGYKYVLWKSFSQLKEKYYKKRLLLLPRIGTDDYSYLISLDWDKNEIFNKIIKEMDFVTNLNSLYTLSVHTHLMSYGSNIDVLENVFKYVKKKKYPILKVKDIAKLVTQRDLITLKVTKAPINLVIRIKNGNFDKVTNFKFRVYLSDYHKIEGLISELSSLKATLIRYPNKNYVDIVVKELKAKTEYNLFLRYKN